jgi:hypothetical protein
VEFSPTEFVYKPEITDEYLQNLYTAKITDYLVPEMLDLFQIVVYVNDWDNETVAAAAYEKMQKAHEELTKGVSFENVRKKYSDDKSSRALGTINKSTSPSELENKLFALKDGEFSTIEKTDYGFAIFKVENRTAARLISFEEALPALRESAENEARERAYRDYVYDFYRKILSAGNITAFDAENAGVLKVQTSELLARNDPTAFFADDAELANSLFTLGRSDVSQIVDKPNGSAIYELIERVESRIPPLEEIKGVVLEDYRLDLAFKDAVQDVNSKAPDNSTAEEFQKIAASFGENIIQIPPFRRIDSSVELAWAGALSDLLFRGEEGDIVKFPELNSLYVYVVRIDRLTPPPAEISETDRAVISGYLTSLKQTDAFNGVVKELRKRYNVSINPVYLQ